jgi:hypothetical protein
MAMIAIFTYDVKPGRMGDFTAKLQAAAHSKFNGKVMPKVIRLFRRTVPGPDTGLVALMIEYENMAAYGVRTDYEISNAEWRELFAAKQNSPEMLVCVELLTEIVPR